MKEGLFGGIAGIDEFRDVLRAFPDVTLVAADAPADLQATLTGAEILLVGNRRDTPENATIIREAARRCADGSMVAR